MILRDAAKSNLSRQLNEQEIIVFTESELMLNDPRLLSMFDKGGVYKQLFRTVMMTNQMNPSKNSGYLR